MNLKNTMHLTEQTKQHEKIDFWLSLFPERSQTEVEDIIYNISGCTIESLAEKSQSYSSENMAIEIHNLFSQVESSTDKEIEIEIIDNMLITLSTNNHWVYFFQPVLLKPIVTFIKKVENYKLIQSKETLLKATIESITAKLTAMSYRVLIIEMNTAKQEELLKGNTSDDRGRYFNDYLLKNKDYVSKIYNRYPVLYQEMTRTVAYTLRYMEEILDNTEKNIAEIENNLNDGNTLGSLNKVILGNGDTHNEGKMVATLIFEKKTIMYKPRNFSIEKSFDAFLQWVNGNVAEFYPLTSCKHYSIENAGWMEFIEHSECQSMEEVTQFYIKMGQLLCLLYSINSKDCHCENLIARGNEPILIDLEAILHTDEYNSKNGFDSIEAYIHRKVQNSVDGVMILPSLLQNFNTNDVMEIGAIGSGRPKKSPYKTQIIKNFDSDEIKVEYVNKDIADAENYPLYKGKAVGGNGYIQYVKKGFIRTYQWILANKIQYKNMVREIFENVECRVIYKATNDYTQVLSTSYHPDLLHDNMDRRFYFHRIGLLIKKNEPFIEKDIYQTEIESMLKGDIPSFHIMSDSKIAYNHKNQPVFCHYKKTILEEIMDKIQDMDLVDLQRQISLINMSYYGCKMEVDMQDDTGTKLCYSSDKTYDYLLLAKGLGEKILSRSFTCDVGGKKEYSWICYNGFGDNYYSINPVGWDLYKGNSGIALLFVQMAEATSESTYLERAKEIMHSVERHIDTAGKAEIDMMGFGAFAGIFSYIIAALSLINKGVYQEAETTEVLQRIDHILSLSKQNLLYIKNLDVLSGLAGMLGVLVQLYHSSLYHKKDKLKQLTERIVNIIYDNAITVDTNMLTWTQNGDIGYAHGNAGIISQLSRVKGMIEDERIDEMIAKGLKYEREKCFDKSSNRWIFRENTKYYSWCNGICGLLLSKIILYEAGYGEEALSTEIDLLIEQLKECGLGYDSSICHGDMGTISVLRYASNFKHSDTMHEMCKATLDSLIENYLVKQEGDIYYMEDWGLMVGKTGISLGLLEESTNQQIIANILALQTL
ncbi:type 2 lanthipeptide synthetase LanM [Anaeromicropila herbilytica]|uniref:Bacteriocin formation protein n=1 Tax=Anaeromicropila herbilytica TaxID=2785025 RepID=A0A7R7EIP4_9FIRM|nr:type 2 lanthipeptide synthetase LanM [Anaeromicropila herbilytica]BCN29890.1 bacteriocin formation protein [Anaeromicropila herbilytica]